MRDLTVEAAGPRERRHSGQQGHLPHLSEQDRARDVRVGVPLRRGQEGLDQNHPQRHPEVS